MFLHALLTVKACLSISVLLTPCGYSSHVSVLAPLRSRANVWMWRDLSMSADDYCLYLGQPVASQPSTFFSAFLSADWKQEVSYIFSSSWFDRLNYLWDLTLQQQKDSQGIWFCVSCLGIGGGVVGECLLQGGWWSYLLSWTRLDFVLAESASLLYSGRICTEYKSNPTANCPLLQKDIWCIYPWKQG